MSDDRGDRPTPTGDGARALRHMVRELVDAPPPDVDWERVEARLFDRIDGQGQAAAMPGPTPRVAPTETAEEVVTARPGRVGPGRERAARQVRGRWLGAWAAVAAVLVAGAAFAWVERMNQAASPVAPRPSAEALTPAAPTAEHVPAARDGLAPPPPEAPPVQEEPAATAPPSPRPRPTALSPRPSDRGAEEPPPSGGVEVEAPPVAPADARPTTSERELTQRLVRCIEQRRAAEREAAREGVEVVVVEIRSQLLLRVGSEGAVEAAMFQPPLRPELQSCAVEALRAQLAPGEREVRIPLVLR